MGNKEVTEFVVKDLNEDPTLPFEDSSFDIVTNVVSIDYLTQPLQVCKEVARVLKPNDLEHVFIVGSYFHYASGFRPPSAVEVSPDQATTPWNGGSSQNNAYLAVVKATVDK